MAASLSVHGLKSKFPAFVLKAENPPSLLPGLRASHLAGFSAARRLKLPAIL
jgi:hypothetical protein